MYQIIEFAKEFNNQMNAILVFSEKEVCSDAAFELKNLAMITGKLGKTSNGLISLKEKNNAQGLFDMGVCPKLGVGAQDVKDPAVLKKIASAWKIKSMPKTLNECQYDSLEQGILKNVFIFGEDPLGCAQNKVKVSGWLSVADFVVVQDYFMTETAQHADIILPASMPFEIGGSFSNTQKSIQEFGATLPSKVQTHSLKQLSALLGKFDLNGAKTASEVMKEFVGLLPTGQEESKLKFHYTSDHNCNRMFDHGCDSIVKRFDEEFESNIGE